VSIDSILNHLKVMNPIKSDNVSFEHNLKNRINSLNLLGCMDSSSINVSDHPRIIESIANEIILNLVQSSHIHYSMFNKLFRLQVLTKNMDDKIKKLLYHRQDWI
jgi:hypothetical protein